MTVTVFSSSCLPCTHRALWKQLKAKAAKNRMLLERRDVRKDPIARYEADIVYGMATPFIVADGIAMSVEEFLNA